MKLVEIKGDLLEADVEVIAHQCNCMSRGASGLAATIFSKYPKTNTYLHNPDPLQFGTFKLFCVSNIKWVANLYSQLAPGPAVSGTIDSPEMRMTAFNQCLHLLGDEMNYLKLESVGFPKFIGCGLGGGKWADYYGELRSFASEFPDIKVVIVEKV